MTNPPTNDHDQRHARQSRRRMAYGATAWRACARSPTMAMPSAAHAQDSGDELRPRLERACLRIPNIEIRTANLIERLNGDASVRGSLAWLQAKIDKAEAEGREQLVTVLENRLAVRTQTLEVRRAAPGEAAGAEAEVHRPRGSSVSFRLAGSARVAIAAVSIGLGAAACGVRPTNRRAERSDRRP